MASYFSIENSKNTVVIDDNYKNATFLAKAKLTNFYDNPMLAVDPMRVNYMAEYDINWRYVASKGVLLNNPADIGIDAYSFSTMGDRTIAFGRCSTSDIFLVEASLTYNDFSNNWYLLLRCWADNPNIEVTISAYTLNKRTESSFGEIAYNEQGEVVFDAMRGVLTNVGLLYGGINLSNSVAATYILNTPTDIPVENIFISMRSMFPIRAAYKISSSGVSLSTTKYFPSMTKVNDSTLKVELVRQNTLGGSSGSTNIGEYSENVIYCPYPVTLA